MKLEEQVCTIEQGKMLVELGVTDGCLYWHTVDIDPITPNDIMQKWQHSHFNECEKYPAFSVAELGLMLPTAYNTMRVTSAGDWDIYNWRGFDDSEKDCPPVEGDINEYETEAQARAEMLIYLLENKLTTPEQCNNSLK